MFVFRVSCSLVALAVLLGTALYLRAPRTPDEPLPPPPLAVSADVPLAMPPLVVPADCTLSFPPTTP